MGSCFSQTIHKYDIHQQPRFYTGDINPQKLNETKYKSKSSKTFAGTNTFEDIQHENEPVAGDIYSKFGSRNLAPIRTMPVLPAFPINNAMSGTTYGLNPYVQKQEVYNRANTDNPLRNLQLGGNGLQLNQNFARSINPQQSINLQQNKASNNNKNSKANRQPSVNIKPTESRYVSRYP